MTPTSFWDKAAPKYAQSPIRDVPAYEKTLERTRSYLSRTDRLLELGCGTGGTARMLAPHVAHITATDISGEMIAIAKTRANDEGMTTITHLRAAPSDTDLPDGPFDAICAFNLLHLIPDMPGALANLPDLLKPGGLFISKTPCMGGIYSAIRLLITPMQWFGKAPYVGYLARPKLERAIINAGFEIVETGDYPKRPPSHFIVARKL